MNTKKGNITAVLASLLIVLFLYTSVSKLLNMRDFRDSMTSQPIAPWLSYILGRTLPFVEILVAILLYINKTRLLGFIISLGMMVSFTIYIGLGLIHAFSRTPCSCGGVFTQMSWQNHFLFNLLFIVISLAGIILLTAEPHYKIRLQKNGRT